MRLRIWMDIVILGLVIWSGVHMARGIERRWKQVTPCDCGAICARGGFHCGLPECPRGRE